MYTLKKDTAIDAPFYLHDTSGVKVTGATISTKRISKGSAGAFAAMTVTITEMENGWYKAALTSSHTDALGLLTLVLSDGTNPQVNLQWRIESNLKDDLSTSIGQISTGSAAISTVAGSAVVTTGTETLTYTATTQLDASTHDIAPAAGNTEFYYQFNIGGNGVPTEFLWDGYVNSNGDSYTVKAYNWGGTSWEQIGVLSGSSGSTVAQQTFQAINAYVGTGANLGLARLQFTSADGTNISTDRVLCSYAVVAQSVGYALGAIWVDTNDSNTNTESYVDGVADNPVSTWAAALTLSSQLGIKRFQLTAGSSITLTAASDSYDITGYCTDVDFNGQSCSGSRFVGCTVTGTCTGATPPRFEHCSMNTVTLPPSTLTQCGFPGTITVGSAGNFSCADCTSEVAGASSPTWNMAAVGATNIGFRRFGGGLSITNIAADDVISAEATVGGTLTINGTGGSVEARGMWKQITDSSGGSVTIVNKAITLNNINAEADTAISDAALALASVCTETRMAELDAVNLPADTDAILVDTGTTLPGSIATVDGNVDAILVDTGTTLPASIAALNDIAATDIVSAGAITTSAGAVSTVTDVTNQIAAAVIADAVWDELQSGHTTNGSYGKGFKQMVEAYVSAEGSINDAGATTTTFITDLTETTSSFYAEQLLVFTSGTLTGQSRPINEYNGTTKSVTVGEAYSEVPANTDTFIILTSHVHSLNGVADALLTRDFNSVSGEASRSALNALRFLRNKWSVTGGVLTVTKENDATSAWTGTVSSDAAADPVTGVDPA